MADLQYPALTIPPPAAFGPAETTFLDKWWKQTSEPVREIEPLPILLATVAPLEPSLILTPPELSWRGEQPVYVLDVEPHPEGQSVRPLEVIQLGLPVALSWQPTYPAGVSEIEPAVSEALVSPNTEPNLAEDIPDLSAALYPDLLLDLEDVAGGGTFSPLEPSLFMRPAGVEWIGRTPDPVFDVEPATWAPLTAAPTGAISPAETVTLDKWFSDVEQPPDDVLPVERGWFAAPVELSLISLPPALSWQGYEPDVLWEVEPNTGTGYTTVSEATLFTAAPALSWGNEPPTAPPELEPETQTLFVMPSWAIFAPAETITLDKWFEQSPTPPDDVELAEVGLLVGPLNPVLLIEPPAAINILQIAPIRIPFRTLTLTTPAPGQPLKLPDPFGGCERRIERFSDQVSMIFNSLLLSGQITQSGVATFLVTPTPASISDAVDDYFSTTDLTNLFVTYLSSILVAGTNVTINVAGTTITINSTGADDDVGDGTDIGASPRWHLVKTYRAGVDLTAAAGTQDITGFTLPAKCVIHKHLFVTTEAGVAVGAGFLQDFLVIGGALQTVPPGDGLVLNNVAGQGHFQLYGNFIYSWTTGTTIAARFNSDVNLNTFTAGAWELRLLLSRAG